MPLEIDLTTQQQVLLSAIPKTLEGCPGALAGPVVYTLNTGNCTLVPVGDDRSVLIVSGDHAGYSVMLVSAEADLGKGVETITDIVVVHVIDAHTAVLGLTVGTPELKA